MNYSNMAYDLEKLNMYYGQWHTRYPKVCKLILDGFHFWEWPGLDQVYPTSSYTYNLLYGRFWRLYQYSTNLSLLL